MRHGTITRGAGTTATLRFERQLAHAPETVWRVLTDNAELAYWFPARIDGPREPGARLQFTFFDKTAEVMDEGLRAIVDAAQRDAASWPADVMQGEMRVYDPPRTLEYTWGGEVLRFELAPHAGGTRLVFTHAIPDVAQATQVGPGWHVCFDSLEGRVAGVQRPATKADFNALEADYARRFGA